MQRRLEHRSLTQGSREQARASAAGAYVDSLFAYSEGRVSITEVQASLLRLKAVLAREAR